jgi:hypothetical protein
MRDSSDRRWNLPWFGSRLGLALLLSVFTLVPAAAREPTESTTTTSLRRVDGAIEARAFSMLRLNATQASREVAQLGRVSAAANVAALRAAGYAPRDVEAAVAATYRLSPTEASRLTREAFSRDLAIDRSAITSTGTEVTVCIMPDGSLRYCPPQERVTYVGTAPASGSDTSTTPSPSGPGWLNALETGTVDHSWVNSYLLALVSYYIYSDALGQPADAEANFRSLMESWGMDEVRFINVPDRHLRVAVMRSPTAVIVAFRGSELQSTAHCLLEAHLPGVCANLPPNWVTNLEFAPLRQRPEWGPNVRTHPGFDSATDLLYAGVMNYVDDWLTGPRRLFVTGHSLGGAMATLFAFRAQYVDNKTVQAVYTYGAPRLGNIPFTAQYQAVLGSRTHRWQNRSDPAPAVPPGQPIQLTGMPAPAAWSTYRHIGRLHYLPATGAAQLNQTAEPFQLPTSASQVAAGDHWMAISPDSYARRLYPRLPQSVRDQMPPPP